MNTIIKLNRIQYNLEHYALYVACFALLALTAGYMYLLSLSVVHVVMSKELEEKTHQVNSDIAGLEAEYMESQHRISNEIVAQTDYVKNVDKIFINKDQSSVVTRR